MKGKLFYFGCITIFLLVITALFADFLAPYDPTAVELSRNLSLPNADHVLGQDKLGRDILSRIIYGARVSVFVGLVVIAVSMTIGVAIGGMSGMIGGYFDYFAMRIVDMLMAFPGIILAIGATAVLGPSLLNVVIALSLISWVGFARLTRAQVLSVKEKDYVMASISIGAGKTRIFFKDILPNISAPIIVEASFAMAGAILAEASLSFLGLGTQPPEPSWGSMLNEGRSFMLVAPHLTIFPGIAIMLSVMALNFIGDGLRDSLDKKGR